MKNVIQRILLFWIIIPGLIALILLVPQYNHVGLNILLVLCGIGLSFESALIVGLYPNVSDKSKLDKACRISAVLLVGSAAPLAVFLVSINILATVHLLPIFIALLLGIFTFQVIRTQWTPLEETLPLVLGYVFILVYPGIGLAFLSALTMLPLPGIQVSVLLLVFLGAVFFNDSAAYVFGLLLGKNSPHPVKVSPKKTLVGFFAGMIFSILVTGITAYVYPVLFPSGIASAIILGAVTGFMVIIGDLFESALKRSAHVKDSGTIIPGRGGLLDSLDSLVFAAPVFYFIYILTQHPSLLGL